jgi:23S rRNA pseudouridine2605 synthase
MREGKNREIRNVLGALGLQVNRLIRVSYGPFQLGELPPGSVIEIKTRALREQLGDRLAAVAGADFSGPIAEREPAPPPPRTAAEKGSPRRPQAPGAERKPGRPPFKAGSRPSSHADGDKARRPRGGGPHRNKRRR